MTINNFLVELGTAELPPTELVQIISDFKQGLTQQLDQAQISYQEIQDFATPRRIALLVKGISLQQPEQNLVLRGPRYEVAFDAAGNPTPATLGWLKSNNLTLEQTTKLTQKEQNFIAFQQSQPGKLFSELANQLVHQAVANIKINKGMRWGDKEFIFIRPLTSYCLLLNQQVIDGELFGIASSNKIFGHRFQGTNNYNNSFLLDDAVNYQAQLLEHFVIADFAARQKIILEQAQQLAQTLNGDLKISQDLIDEITALTEWPKAYIAEFDASFLEVPIEPLVITMEGDQRYFPIYKGDKLLPYFIFVSNVEPQDPSLIIKGNQRVVIPRLSDAQFFYNQDLKTPLTSYQTQLDKVGFQAKLGTMQDKTQRLIAISQYLAQELAADNQQQFELAEQAAALAKCDLLTNLVREYPTTQGKSGYYYSLAQGHPQEVAQALYEQYLPSFSGDKLPQTSTGIILALADKLDNLVGIAAIGLLGKGTKDPFALRRATIGILRIVDELNLKLDLVKALEFTLGLFKAQTTNSQALVEIMEFIQVRQKGIYQQLGYSIEEINAVQALGLVNPADFKLRIQALKEFQNSSSFANLTKSYKRINNILNGQLLSQEAINLELAQTESETVLSKSLIALQNKLSDLLEQQNYYQALSELSALSDAIDNFFADNMINAEDPKIKANRYVILSTIKQLINKIADISHLKG